ncbi:hypothetical protein [Micromonospora sp. NBC_01796]|uniref:hypothetical protein n=1 Tax=Micromonospora sp. NBC_01796 TaxID=2975987 RepID=UPI002DD7EECB|nr:hypothetical protein [Micromonospora sp. NBC_01796]WSA87380.1 hypothetical protein OIE47_07150 [Micromonospora sp. NBC_01796]
MPLVRFDTDPVQRPTGLVPPIPDLEGVTELRLHGVGGTTPQDLLGDDAPLQVSGDRIAGFYRTADVAGRHVEAYSWGGMTSRAGSRVLWLLLFPFALANVAGWMCTPRTHASGWRFRLHRTATRWAALFLTLNLLLISVITALELLAYQCAGRARCAEQSWLLRPLRDPLLADFPGRRLLLGALAPLALVALLAVLTLRSIGRYEAVNPPLRVVATASTRSAAQPGVGLSDPTFWAGGRSTHDLGHLHLGAGLGFVGMSLAHTVHATSSVAGAPVTAGWLHTGVLLAGGGLLLAVLVLTALDACPPGSARAVFALGAVTLVGAGWFAAIQPGYAQPFGYLPGIPLVSNLTLGAVGVSLLLVLVASLCGGWRRGTFVIFGPFVAQVLGVFALNVVLLGAMSRFADLVAEVSSRSKLPSAPTTGAEVYIYPIVAKMVNYLTLAPLALILLFVLYELVVYWRAGADRATVTRICEWYRGNVAEPTDERRWQYDAAGGGVSTSDVTASGTAGRAWGARLARARRFAGMAHDLDKLMTVMAVAVTTVVIAIQVRYVAYGKLPWGTQWAYTLGSYLASGIPLALIVLLRRGWRNLESRRRIGVLWDVMTFWPRAYHPLAPPSYAERAVPEVQRRLWRIHDRGGRVVVTAHSQGTVIAAAALLQPHSRPDDDVVGLVTFGSPLRTLYGWAFPAYFGETVLRQLSPADDTTGAAVHEWRNFYYLTDYIGGPVLPDRGGPEERVDVELPDPPTSWHIYGQPEPVAGRHSGYWSDPAVWLTVDRLAGELATTAAVPLPRTRPDDPARLRPVPRRAPAGPPAPGC